VKRPLVLTVLAGVVLAGVLAASPAEAHAVLVSLTPADNSTVTRAPERVRLVFDENIRSPSKIVVSGPSRRRVDHGSTSVVDNRVSVAVSLRPRPAYVGRYVIGWRVVSADGHVVSGERSFEYRPAGVKASHSDVVGHSPKSRNGASHVWWYAAGAVLVVVVVYLLLRPRRGSGSRR
jgi:hypothetical protein